MDPKLVSFIENMVNSLETYGADVMHSAFYYAFKRED